MKTPEVVKCPDGHFRHAIYGIGPYIADYPEQVWLAAIVQGWCPKYAPFFFLVPLPITANLSDVMRIHAEDTWWQSHQKTEFLITSFNPGILWDDFGVCSDIVLCLPISV